MAGKAHRAPGALTHYGNRAWGFSRDSTRLLYIAGVLPIVTQAIEARLPADGYRGVASLFKSFQSLQRSAAIHITGALKSTSIEALTVEADLKPVNLACYQIQARAAVRWLLLPDTHPLTHTIKIKHN